MRKQRTRLSSDGGESPASSASGSYASLMRLFPPPEASKDADLQVMVAGLRGVGKTSLVAQLLSLFRMEKGEGGAEEEEEATVQISAQRRLSFLQLNPARNDLWSSLSVSGYILVFGQTEPESLRSVESVGGWLRQSLGSHVPIFLVGTHADYPPEQRLPEAESKLLAERLSAHLYSLSTKAALSSDPTQPLCRLLNDLMRAFAGDENTPTIGAPLQHKLQLKAKLSVRGRSELATKYNLYRRKKSFSCENLFRDLREPC